MEAIFELKFDGRLAEYGELDLYDASVSMMGASRTLAILGHYYATGKILHQAPFSTAEVTISPPEEGSYKQALRVGILSAVIAAPFGEFASYAIRQWLPPSGQENQYIELMEEKNKLQELDLMLEYGTPEQKQEALESLHAREQKNETPPLESHKKNIQVIRSITSKSFKDIFRPIGRSAESLVLSEGNEKRTPFGYVDTKNVGLIESEKRDKGKATILGVVNSFSRPSKSGVMFSRQIGRGFRFTYNFSGRLPSRDDFSWSQYNRRPIEVKGEFVRFFDGSIKRFEVSSMRRCDPEESIEYFETDFD